ncbi:potassium channel family protein [Rahnella sp. CJA17(1/100)]|uniref:potassium channel family protein n=1 Tax=Rahnella sp. CJA17(1/100) TaxID=2508951 RepID=UPI0010700E02|nr:potassium channel family protein [Rahnella sp. CJA17(1/100)]
MNQNYLWEMSPEEFNKWRRNNDYPRLFEAFKSTLPFFNEWMQETNITKEIMFAHGLGVFIGAEENWSVFEYTYSKEKHVFRTNDPKISHLRDPNITTSELIFDPYFYWLKKNKGNKIYSDTRRNFRITSWVGGKPEFMKKAFLLNLGNVSIKSPIISGRLLDFVCLDSLKMIGAINNTRIQIWFSSAKGLEIEGGIAFLSFLQTPLWDWGYGDIKKEFILSNGLFQELSFKNCSLRIHSIRSKLNLCSFEGMDFEATMEHSEISNSTFTPGKDECSSKESERNYYRKLKNLYTGFGNQIEAGKFFYKEKRSEMLSFLMPSKNFKDRLKHKNIIGKTIFYLYCYLSFTILLLSFLIWGFGEKPIRSLYSSIATVFGSSMIYYFNTSSVTLGDFANSFYFSLVTFVTLGYGDIYQTEKFLKLYAAFEAFIGLVLMGSFLAGLASKSKQY